MSIKQKAEIDFSGYDAMKARIDELHNSLKDYQVDPHNFANAKSTRARLNKLSRDINQRKLEIIRDADKPITEFKVKIKGLVDEINEVSGQIGTGIKAYEDKAKQDKREQNLKRIVEAAKLVRVDSAQVQYKAR